MTTKREKAQQRVNNLKAQIEQAKSQILLPGLEKDFHDERIQRLSKKIKSALVTLAKLSLV